jgi:hypothetical protein
MDIIDFHVHGGSPERSNEIARYIEQSGISAMGMLSLPRPPDESKATYNDEIREGLRRIHGLRPAFPIISFGSLDDEALIGSAIASGDGSRAGCLKESCRSRRVRRGVEGPGIQRR